MGEDRSAVVSKACGLCGGECAGMPRIRDKHGRYFHRACVEEHKAKEEGGKDAKSDVVVKAKTPPPLPLPGKVGGTDDGAMSLAGSGVFDDIPDQRALIGEPCPKCGTGMKDGAVICTMCGYDAASGRVHRTAVIKTKAPKERKQKAGGGESSLPHVSVLVMCGLMTLIGIGGLAEPSMAVAAYLIAAVGSLVTLIAAIVKAFERGDSGWGVAGILSFFIPGVYLAMLVYMVRLREKWIIWLALFSIIVSVLGVVGFVMHGMEILGSDFGELGQTR